MQLAYFFIQQYFHLKTNTSFVAIINCKIFQKVLVRPLTEISVSVNRTFNSVQFSLSVVSDSLRPHELQHARPRCPSPTPGVDSDSRPSSKWCHPAISSSVVSFSCPQSLPASESFPMSQLFVGHCKSSAKGKVYSNTGIPQEIRKKSNK